MKLRTTAAASCLLCALAAPAAEAHDELQTSTRTQAGSAIDLVTRMLAPKVVATSGRPEDIGAFGAPFVEPTLAGRTTDAKCVDGANVGALKRCKPAAGSLIGLPGGRVAYWDALGGTENVKFSIVGEFGAVAVNDEARVLDPAGPTWTQPTPVDGGANPNGEDDAAGPLIPGGESTEPYNDGALFGSTQSFLADGRVLVTGGTDYSLDPGVTGVPFGVVELSGLKAARIFDPSRSTFVQTGSMAKGRWYPTQITLGSGQVLDVSGVRKLLKPVYKDAPADSLQNELTIERYDPRAGTWKDEGAAAKRDLPLYPRLHLLPNGKVFYNVSGQAFNPFGQSLGELGWNEAAVYDPKTKAWTGLGIPGSGTPTDGFRGSTTSTMLPLEPGADGRYTKARFLTAGGVLLPSPGSYLPVADSRITTVDTSGAHERLTTKPTGPFSVPRWFSQNVVLPTGEVMAFSGADKDEVVGPGTEMPRQQAELFDPETGRWRPMAVANRPRTYHNTAALLPSGEVLIGGHATISTLYLNNTTLPGGFAPHDGRDPSFETYRPPYLYRGARPGIKSVRSTVRPGATFGIRLTKGTKAADVEKVVLLRHTALTHLVDADQRAVVLPVQSRRGNLLLVKAPPTNDVAPAGPYMLFVNREGEHGLVPSTAAEVAVSQATTGRR